MDTSYAIEAVGGTIVLILAVAAVVSVIRSPIHRPLAKAGWAVVAVVIPIAGPALWFFRGRATAEERVQIR